jgi:putative colanic acid biosynthesis glycosyltransferase
MKYNSQKDHQHLFDKYDLIENSLSKVSSNEKPLVSIITVVFNAEKTIEATIKSVINQSYNNIEYIIIDGKSTDNTISIIDKYQDGIGYWITEADRGVYDAMNKGIDRANGDWLIFLGADDELFDKLVVEKLIKTSELRDENSEKSLIVFGNTLYTNGKYFRSFLSIRTLIRNTVQHQSAMYHRSLFDDFRYDSSFRICSDYELNLLVYLKNIQSKYINSTISTCSYGGLSNNFNNRTQAIEELNNIRGKHIPTLANQAISTFLNIRLSIKILIHRFLSE